MIQTQKMQSLRLDGGATTNFNKKESTFRYVSIKSP